MVHVKIDSPKTLPESIGVCQKKKLFWPADKDTNRLLVKEEILINNDHLER